MLLVLCLGMAAAVNAAEQPTQNAAAESVSHSDYQCAIASAESVLGNTSNAAAIERVTIETVTDGDTVVLSDRRKVRIIGINTAELSKKSERTLKAEAMAARDLINKLASQASHLTLVTGDESRDRYGRVLAHLLLPDGRSLATLLLEQGLAAATAVAPNTRCAEHFYRIEQVARGQNRGIWQHANNPWFAKDVSTNSIQGFHILQAPVKSVEKKRSRWRIELANGVRVYAKEHLLNRAEANELVGNTVEARGWFGRRDGRVSINMHHRKNLTTLP